MHEHVRARVGESRPFHFEHSWRINAPATVIWDRLTDVDTWSQWWSGMSGHRAGDSARIRVRGFLRMALDVDLRLTNSDRPRFVVFTAAGDLRGAGAWTFVENGPITTVHIVWCVTTRRRLLRALRPAARFSHDRVMHAGELGLRRHLGQQH